MGGTERPTIIDEVDLEAPGDDLDGLAFAMYQKAVRLGTWQPAAVDLSRDAPDVEALDEHHRAYLERFAAAFSNAEENVAKLFGPWVMAAPTTWTQALFSTQLLEEFKHVEFFHRYFGEVFGHRNVKTTLANPVHDTLRDRSPGYWRPWTRARKRACWPSSKGRRTICASSRASRP